MAPYRLPAAGQASRKRKDAPVASSNAKSAPNKRQKVDHQARRRDARVLSAQTTSKAFQNGALDVSAFVKAREFEIHALEQGIQRSGKANNRRAFQQVPKELRRRTASHNAKRIPKRLRARAEKEMIEDNTPTINARTRKPTRQMRLRMDTAKRLRALESEKRAKQRALHANKASDTGSPSTGTDNAASTGERELKTRKPRVKTTPLLATPPKPKAKFRKRQKHKSWLPTHLFHTKRAHMTPPSSPLWRYAIPLASTQKSYRPTHRTIHDRGAIAWDTSYVSTIGLEGTGGGVETVLKGLGVDLQQAGIKWRNGTRARTMWMYERDCSVPIAPATIFWCASSIRGRESGESDVSKQRCKLFIRVHPAGFNSLWNQIVRLASVAKPSVCVEDLRFEIGSIEITGSGSTEALRGALWPIDEPEGSVESLWVSLAGLNSPSALPAGALLGFDVQDPRLHHPPRTASLPDSPENWQKLLETLADWPIDRIQPPPNIFSRVARQQGAKLRSQKAVNRRKSLAKPGEYPDALATDPRIPIALYAEQPVAFATTQRCTSSWTLLAPWKTIQPIWYSIQYCPLTGGGQPRFGGLNERRQMAFEAGQPFFPADFPGTQAGWDWETKERAKRHDEWERRPKGKRTSWDKVDAGGGTRGEIARGWACDWSYLLDPTGADAGVATAGATHLGDGGDASSPEPKPALLSQLSPTQTSTMLESTSPILMDLPGKLMTVRVTPLARGVPRTCARIYRLPSAASNEALRQRWLGLHTTRNQPDNPNGASNEIDAVRMTGEKQARIRQKRLARSLLRDPVAVGDKQPPCPGAEDLIGFVTTGNFNLAEGKGTGIGCLLAGKVVGNEDSRLCIVRNSGETVGRLATWEGV